MLNNIKLTINHTLVDTTISINLVITENTYIEDYKKKIKIPIHIFNHLISLYNNKIHNDFTNKDIIDIKILEYIYILFNRYLLFQNGNNQASILPSFKKLLKTYFNIKIELFGSPLNTSNANFGSFFYDCEKNFGSIGNFFNTDIKKGYYEINPYFDKCAIKAVFVKGMVELIEADKNKLPLLFCYIIPVSYYTHNKLPKDLKAYISHNIILEKNKFPYIRYNRSYTKTNVSPIVNTNILICNTKYVNDFVKKNIDNFVNILNNWTKDNNV